MLEPHQPVGQPRVVEQRVGQRVRRESLTAKVLKPHVPAEGAATASTAGSAVATGSRVAGTTRHLGSAEHAAPVDHRVRSVSDHELQRIHDNSTATSAGRAHYPSTDERALQAARTLKPVDNTYVLDAHSDGRHIIIGDQQLNAADVARLIRNDPAYHGQDVLLMSCNTGGTTDSLAAHLAQHLDVKVSAPDTTVWSTPEHGTPIATSHADHLADPTHYDGTFHDHHPDGTTTPSTLHPPPSTTTTPSTTTPTTTPTPTTSSPPPPTPTTPSRAATTTRVWAGTAWRASRTRHPVSTRARLRGRGPCPRRRTRSRPSPRTCPQAPGRSPMPMARPMSRA